MFARRWPLGFTLMIWLIAGMSACSTNSSDPQGPDAGEVSGQPDGDAHTDQDLPPVTGTFRALLLFYDELDDARYGILAPDGSLTVIPPIQALTYYRAADLEVAWDHNLQPTRMMCGGYWTDDSGVDVAAVWPAPKETPVFIDPPTAAEPSNGSNMVVFNRMGVDSQGTVHSLIHAKMEPGPVWFHYHVGDQYVELPRPSSGLGVHLSGLKEFNGDIYVYGFEEEGANRVKPLVWKNGQLIESFAFFDAVMGALHEGGYRGVTLRDLAVEEDGTILVAGWYYQNPDGGSEPWRHHLGYFRSDGKYIPVAGGYIDQRGYLGHQAWVSQIASAKDYLIEKQGHIPDDVYLDGKLVEVETPAAMIPEKPVTYARMMHDGQDVYLIGGYESPRNLVQIQRVTVWKNTRILTEIETAELDGMSYRGFYPMDLAVPQR